MNGERAARRRQRLRQYLAERLRNDRGALIQKSGLTKGRIAQLLDDRQPFGERAAQDLARRLSLPVDYFDSPARDPAALAVELDRLETALLDLWKRLVPEQRTEVMQKIEEMARLNQQAYDLLAALNLDKAVPDDEVAKHLPPRPAQRELPAIPASPRKRKS